MRELELSTPPDDVDAVHEFLADAWTGMPDVGARDRMAFETALVELVANVIQHSDHGAGVRCVVLLDLADGRLRAVLRDTGDAGDFVLRDAEMPDSEAESGRGLALVQALVDELSFERSAGHNVWRISRTVA